MNLAQLIRVSCYEETAWHLECEYWC